ncbi:hypothetical protein VCRA2110O318_40052 [Vibrio crassostreae]|nr:hypothetical protein VCRA2117O328_40051 [Vibrio crassostreae]CAK2335232.1 hypothetical protein VCRA2110O318_40052 [Vibrio crassostreae]CAK2503631.1 hypothetical protein VCRA2110O319_50052 [Vibrio crassostreae]CAK2910512.1 hypothetical protein VCRA217O317_30241 [Vibrio crassostreae]
MLNTSISVVPKLVTPELARKYLATANVGNRPVCPKRVGKFIAIIKFGGWAHSAATIVISSQGNLIDGQHKLHAVVATGMTVPFIVISGAEHKDIVQHDSTERSMADQLTIIGIPENKHAVIGAYLKRVYNYSVYKETHDEDALSPDMPAGMVKLVYQKEQEFINEHLFDTYHHINKSQYSGYAGHIAVAVRAALSRDHKIETISDVLKEALNGTDNLFTNELKKRHNKRAGATTAPIVKAMLDACQIKSNQGWAF